MTPQKLAELRDRTKVALNYRLDIAKAMSAKGLTNIAYYDERLLQIKVSKTVSITNGEDNVDAKLTKLMKVTNNGIGSKITMFGSTKPLGRYDYFDHVTFKFIRYEVKSEVPESLISELTKKALLNIVKPKDWDNYRTFLLDCNLMTLFKEGKMTMDRVIELSNENCEL